MAEVFKSRNEEKKIMTEHSNPYIGYDKLENPRQNEPLWEERTEPLDEVLKQRGERYGDFNDNAQIAQGLKDIIRSGKSWDMMTPVMKEGLDMIMSKASRIVAGDPYYLDNWDDIQGFAKIIRDRIEQ